MDRMDERLAEIDRGDKMPGTMREGRQALGSDPVARPDLGQMARDLYSRMTGRGTDRDTRDTSRSSRR